MAETIEAADGTGWREGLYVEAREVYEAQAPARAARAAARNPLLSPERRSYSVVDLAMLQAPRNLTDKEVLEAVNDSIKRDAARYQAAWLNRLLVRPVYEHQFRKAHFGVYSILGIPVLVSLTW